MAPSAAFSGAASHGRPASACPNSSCVTFMLPSRPSKRFNGAQAAVAQAEPPATSALCRLRPRSAKPKPPAWPPKPGISKTRGSMGLLSSQGQWQWPLTGSGQLHVVCCFVVSCLSLCICVVVCFCLFVLSFVCLCACFVVGIVVFLLSLVIHLPACLLVGFCLFLNQHHAPTCTEALKALGRPVEAGPLWAKFRS